MGLLEILLFIVALLLLFGMWWLPRNMHSQSIREAIHRTEDKIEELEMKLDHNLCEDSEYTRKWISKLQHKVQQLRKRL